MIHEIQKRFEEMPEAGLQSILEYLGLERRRGVLSSALPVMGALAAGMLAGAGVALLLAPRPGKELRADIQRKLVDIKDRRLPELVDQAFEQARTAGVDLGHKGVLSHNSSPG
jgi:hypothetical protein